MTSPETMTAEVLAAPAPQVTPEVALGTLFNGVTNLDEAWESFYKPQRRAEVVQLVRQKLSQAQASFEPVKAYAAAYNSANRFQQDQEIKVVQALENNKLFASNNAGLLRWAESYCGNLTQYKHLFV